MLLVLLTQLLVLLVTTGLNEAAKIPRIPNYVKLCKRTDPALNRCILDSVDKLKPYLLKGIPEFHIPPFDPLKIPQVELSEGAGRPVSFVAKFSDIKVYGARNVQLNNVNVDLDKLRLEVDLDLPKLRLLADYEVGGRILLVPVQGQGRFDGNFTDVNAVVTITGVPDIRKGLTFTKLTNQQVKLEINNVQLNFGNLFNGNRELGEATNRFFNENWRDLMSELRPILEDTIAELINGMVRPVFDLFPLEHLLPFD